MFNNLGIRHIALNVRNFEECFRFYSDVLGMSVDWKPDNENVYLTNGSIILLFIMHQMLTLVRFHHLTTLAFCKNTTGSSRFL